MPEEGVDRALKALRRFRILGEFMQLADMQVVATAAAREAKNGAAFLAAAEEAIGTKIELLSGRREAELSALGVLSAIYKPDGIVGDLGGGSLELIKVKRSRIGKGASLPLGGLALMDASDRRCEGVEELVRPHVLCGRRHLAGAGAAAHASAQLSAEHHAQLYDPRARRR